MSNDKVAELKDVKTSKDISGLSDETKATYKHIGDGRYVKKDVTRIKLSNTRIAAL
jgi:hypothetical protein